MSEELLQQESQELVYEAQRYTFQAVANERAIRHNLATPEISVVQKTFEAAEQLYYRAFGVIGLISAGLYKRPKS
ncbi:MAG: hypothetical protein ABIQ89_00940 [Candidatus Saccharimonadales bacterium]